jgi:hypothetical protein
MDVLSLPESEGTVSTLLLCLTTIFYYAYKSILLEILPLILEAVYAAVYLLPLIQYDGIFSVL